MIQSIRSTENDFRLSTIWVDFKEGKTCKQTNTFLYFAKGRLNAFNKVSLPERKPCPRCVNVKLGNKKIVNS